MSLKKWDDRRDLAVPGNHDETLTYALEHFISAGKGAIEDHGTFYVALSGGSTPKAIYQALASEKYRDKLDWNHVHLFWGDERSAAPDSADSNYRMAMDSGMGKLPIPKNQIHRMVAETDIENNAAEYEKIIRSMNRPFDLIMLGMGDDGHTASLFPKTKALEESKRLIVANFVPQKDTWRMTMTYPCINAATHIAIYVLGKSKASMLRKVLKDESSQFPSANIGTSDHKALWIADIDAAKDLQ